MELGRSVINEFKGTMSHPSYWGKPYPRLFIIRKNITSGKYDQLDDGRIHVEYGWSDAMVELEERNGFWEFNNTIGST